MKSLNIIFAFLLVLFGSSNVFAQTCPDIKKKEITKYSDGIESEYFYSPYVSPAGCICLIFKHEGYRTSWISSRQDINGYYPKTHSVIGEILDKNSRCPNENEYQTIVKPTYVEEGNEYSIASEKFEKEKARRKENERLKAEAALAAKINEIEKVCKGIPKVNQSIIENISIAGRIDPGSIRLNRVHVTEEGDCMAVFYTSIGLALAPVGFNANGVIVSNQRIVFPK
jgi:hypothetical protein